MSDALSEYWARGEADPAKPGPFTRYICTCGHCGDLKDLKPSRQQAGRHVLALEVFEEPACEVVLVHR